MQVEQQVLDLFTSIGFDDLLKQHKIPNLSIVFNKRSKKSWQLAIKPDKQKTLTIPHLLKDAPKNIKESLIFWTQLKKPHFKKDRNLYFKQKKMLENQVWSYLEKKGILSGRRHIHNPEKYTSLTKGEKYDLGDIFSSINNAFFENKITSYIRWGAYASKTSYQANCSDQHEKPFNLITIAGIYNHKSVPEFAIHSVMYHEMLHIAIPPYKKNGKNIIHGQEFKKAEQRNPDLKKWLNWEKKEVYKILKDLNKKNKHIFFKLL